MQETVLVTGGAGFIGSALVDALIRRGNRVIVYDNLEAQVHKHGRPSFLSADAELVSGDMRDRAGLQSVIERADVVFHEAAAVGVGQSMYQIDKYVDVNTRGTALLLDILVNTKNRVRKLVAPGSMSAYGEGRYCCPNCGSVAPSGRSEGQLRRGQWELSCERCGAELVPAATDEAKPLQSNSVYALTKQHQEQLILSVSQAYGLPAVVLRYFNVYGPNQSLDNPYTGVAAIFISRLKNGNQPLVFEDGNQSRDFVSVHDIVAANLTVLDDPRADQHVFNVGTGSPVSVLQLAKTLSELLGANIEPAVNGAFRKGDIRHCFADIGKIQSVTGWSPKVTLRDGLGELVRWSETVEADDRVDQATSELAERGLIVS